MLQWSWSLLSPSYAMTRFSLEPLSASDWHTWRAFRLRHRSEPRHQFADHVRTEARRLARKGNRWRRRIMATTERSEGGGEGEDRVRDGLSARALRYAARDRVRAEWVRRGIWRAEFEAWMGEEQSTSADVISLGWNKRRIGEKTARAVDAEATGSRAGAPSSSTPAAIFAWELGQETARIERWHAGEVLGDCSDREADEAYRVVRRQWEARGIWLPGWTGRPGRRWGHEIPVEEWYRYNNNMAHVERAPERGAFRGLMRRYRERGRGRRVRWVDEPEVYLGLGGAMGLAGAGIFDTGSEDGTEMRDSNGDDSFEESESSCSANGGLERATLGPRTWQRTMAWLQHFAEKANFRSVSDENCGMIQGDWDNVEGFGGLSDGGSRKEQQDDGGTLEKNIEQQGVAEKPQPTSRKESGKADVWNPPICLGSNCQAHTVSWWQHDEEGKSWCEHEMPGVFPGDQMLYRDYGQASLQPDQKFL